MFVRAAKIIVISPPVTFCIISKMYEITPTINLFPPAVTIYLINGILSNIDNVSNDIEACATCLEQINLHTMTAMCTWEYTILGFLIVFVCVTYLCKEYDIE